MPSADRVTAAGVQIKEVSGKAERAKLFCSFDVVSPEYEITVT
jgi:hypothetical protein